MLYRLYDWFCNCWRRQPVTPMQNLVVDCEGPSTGYNPLTGIACFPPDYVPIDVNWNGPFTDHPQCWGAKHTSGVLHCPDRPVQVWRVVFPCPMVGTSVIVPNGLSHRSEVRSYNLPDPSDAPCQRCWILNVEGIADPDGSIGEGCCDDLNGDYVLCWSDKLSTSSEIVWQSSCDDSGCARQAGDTQRAKWKLSYNRTTGVYELRSHRAVQYPVYRAESEEPCDTDTLTLTAVTPETETSGCVTYPATVEVRKPGPIVIGNTAEESLIECDECYRRYFDEQLIEHGHSLSLSAYCGVNHHQWRDTRERSADPNAGTPYGAESPCERVVPVGCCHVEGEYIYEAVTPRPCCPEQQERWSGRHDPWRQTEMIGDGCPDVPVVVWALDLSASPRTLTGTFGEGDIVYEVVGDLQCDGITRLELSSTTVGAEVFVPPEHACMVADLLQSCNVRLTDEIIAGTATAAQRSAICAGYDQTTGHVDFCEAGDTCEPSLPGQLIFGCAQGDVCWTRTSYITPQHINAKTVFPRVACVSGYKSSSGGGSWWVNTAAVYPIGGGDWAVDVYCDEMEPEQVNDPRRCGVCTQFASTFIETIVITPTSTCPLILSFQTSNQNEGDCCSGHGCVGTTCSEQDCTTVCCPDGGSIPDGSPLSLTFGTWWQPGGGYPLAAPCPVISIFADTTISPLGNCRWRLDISRESGIGSPFPSTMYGGIELEMLDSSLPINGCPGSPPIQPCCARMSISATCTFQGGPPHTFVREGYSSYSCSPFEIVFSFGGVDDYITVTL